MYLPLRLQFQITNAGILLDGRHRRDLVNCPEKYILGSGATNKVHRREIDVFYSWRQSMAIYQTLETIQTLK
jgi:hypothetical protein